MLVAVGILTGLAILIGVALLVAGIRLQQNEDSPVDKICALLPQTQCAQCGYPGCRPYAEAILAGEAGIDQCAPGGNATVTAMARLLGRTTGTVNPAFGKPGPASVAMIDESACIGCVLCINACPVDAIAGAAQYAHTVIRDECTGCELCVAPCPVDCITIVPRRQPVV